MAYLDSHGLQTLFTKLKTTFAKNIGVTTGDSKVTVQIKDGAATPNVLASADINAASSSSAGVMSKADKTKLDGIEAGANNYVHPTTAGNKHIPAGGSTGQILGYDSAGTAKWMDAPDTGVTKIEAGSNVQISPAAGTGVVTVSATDTTYSDMQGATASAAGAHGLVPAPAAGKNNSFLKGDGTWAVPTDTDNNQTVKGAGTAFGANDAIDIVAGSNVTVTPNTTNKKITIAAIDTTYESKSAASGGTAVSLCTTGEKYTWNGKQSALTQAQLTACDSGISAVKVEQYDEYRTSKQDSLSTAQMNAANSGITSSKVSTYDGYATSKQDTVTFNTTYNPSTNKAATMSDIETAMTGAAKYKGTLASEAAFTALTNYKVGDYYIASATFTHATGSGNITIDSGNMIFVKTAYASAYSPADFDIIQTDIESIPDSEINALS